MEYHVLASGSKGNSIFIYDQGNGLLIDCGISKRQLTSKMAMYNIYSQQSLSYPLLKWNDVGNICEDWTVEELTKLAMEIDAYVTPLVEKQQAYEKMVQKVSNIEEFNIIENLVFN